MVSVNYSTFHLSLPWISLLLFFVCIHILIVHKDWKGVLLKKVHVLSLWILQCVLWMFLWCLFNRYLNFLMRMAVNSSEMYALETFFFTYTSVHMEEISMSLVTVVVDEWCFGFNLRQFFIIHYCSRTCHIHHSWNQSRPSLWIWIS